MKTEIIYMSLAPFRGLTKTRNMYYTLCSLTLGTHKLTESETFKASFSDLKDPGIKFLVKQLSSYNMGWGFRVWIRELVVVFHEKPDVT